MKVFRTGLENRNLRLTKKVWKLKTFPGKEKVRVQEKIINVRERSGNLRISPKKLID